MEGAEEDNKKKMKEWTGLEFVDSQTKLRELLRTAQTSGRAGLELINSVLTNSVKVMVLSYMCNGQHAQHQMDCAKFNKSDKELENL